MVLLTITLKTNQLMLTPTAMCCVALLYDINMLYEGDMYTNLLIKEDWRHSSHTYTRPAQYPI